MADAAARRQAFRAILQADACTQFASVFDPVSARLAERAGFRGGFLAGGIAAAVVHAAPDIGVLTLTELAEQVRRVTRASDLPLCVDGDHGYGNALNAIWAVREIEAAGAAAITIEDIVAPQPYGRAEDCVLPEAEFADKLRAALAARRDPAFSIVGQTIVAPLSGVEEVVARARLIETAGADAVMIYKAPDRACIAAVRAAIRIPLVLAPLMPDVNDGAFLAANGVRISFLGHQPFRAAVAALDQAYRMLFEDHETARAAALGCTPDLLGELLRRQEVGALMRDFMKADSP